jgi:hypothetical protein
VTTTPTPTVPGPLSTRSSAKSQIRLAFNHTSLPSSRSPTKIGDEAVFRAEERVHRRTRNGDDVVIGYVHHKAVVRGRLCVPILWLSASELVVVKGNVEPRRDSDRRWSNCVVAPHLGIQIEFEPIEPRQQLGDAFP